ncbi:MAG: ATP-binding protein [Gemmatimonadaceae bacterium]|nr:ATP-binding protein [Gemmatimonadaceae bacterium]
MARTIANELLEQKLAESLAARHPARTARTARDVRVPDMPEKAVAVIGVRRAGKTSLMHRLIQERIAAGDEPTTHLLLSLEDERLVGMTAADLGWLIDEHRRRQPTHSDDRQVSVYLDEIQLVEGWATLVRRLLDARATRVFVSGSSAKLLSREIGTSLRGRAMEVVVYPFSFREALRHVGREPMQRWAALTPDARAEVQRALHGYLHTGGFPEAQTVDARDRGALLRSYVDVMVLRDVIDRHAVSNPEALRRLQRHLLSNPAARFSVSKMYNDFRSQGLTVSKDTLYAYLAHLEDAFLVRPTSLFTASDRQRAVNPRNSYPIDHGLIPLYERAGRESTGHALEALVRIELERRGCTVSWARGEGDVEVDFVAENASAAPTFIQVCVDVSAEATWHREVRALEQLLADHPHALGLLLTLDAAPPARPLPPRVRWCSAAEWLLDQNA